ncbi:MAG: PaaI family thioesterase [Pyrinomonadaceae bacterium]|nr:PaaI family thioesterase [Pyrinomonadaceae bacterium]
MIFEPRFESFRDKVKASFESQPAMATIGAMLTRIDPGEVDIEMPFSAALSQQHGFLHAGITAAIADSACGFAALTLMDEDSEVLSVEFKINLLSPAVGEKFRAEGRVLRSGRNISVVRGEVFAIRDLNEKIVAAMQGTMMQISK